MIFEDTGEAPASTAKHQWIDSPAATGSLWVCKHCGVRRLPSSERTACNGSDDAIGPSSAAEDYDPLA